MAQDLPLCISVGAARRLNINPGVLIFRGNSVFVSYQNARRLKQDIEQFLPHIYKPNKPAPHITPFMIPRTSWGKNLRSFLDEQDWDRIRKQVYRRDGYRCVVCGNKGRLEADENWRFEQNKKVQTLVGINTLCHSCHCVKHYGHSVHSGEGSAAFSHMIKINGWTEAQARKQIDLAYQRVKSRHNIDWHIDIGFAEREFGVKLSRKGMRNAKLKNKQIQSGHTSNGFFSWLFKLLFRHH